MADTQQKATPVTTDETLQWKYIGILLLRAQGLTYEEIGKRTGLTAQYLRRLFMKGGKLHALFQEFAKVYHGEMTEETMNVIFGNMPDVARTMVATAQLPFTPASVMAGRVLLEYGLGSPEQRVKLNATVGVMTFADYVKQITLKEQQDAEQSKQTTSGQGDRVEEKPAGVHEGGVA